MERYGIYFKRDQEIPGLKNPQWLSGQRGTSPDDAINRYLVSMGRPNQPHRETDGQYVAVREDQKVYTLVIPDNSIRNSRDLGT